MHHFVSASLQTDRLTRMTVEIPAGIMMVLDTWARMDLRHITDSQQSYSEYITEAATRLRSRSHEWIDQMHPDVSSVVRAASPGGIHVALLHQEIYLRRWYDMSLIEHIRRGFPYVGDIPINPTAIPSRVRKAIESPQTLLDRAPQIRERILSKLASQALNRHQAPEAEEQRADRQAIWDQTQVDSEIGRMTELQPVDLSTKSKGLITKRFGVRQISSKGISKLRCIDDLLESGINGTCDIRRKIRMDTITLLIIVMRVIIAIFGDIDLHFIKSDFKAAYRSCPIDPRHKDFTAIALLHPESLRIWITSQLAMPFGALAAVYAWDRLGAAIQHVIQSALLIPVLRYVDDLFSVLPAAISGIAMASMLSTVASFGLVLDPDKTPKPADQMVILGVLVEYLRESALGPILNLSIDESKRLVWIELLERCIRTKRMIKPDAEKIAGRFEFAASNILGSWVRSRIRSIYDHVTRGSPKIDEKTERDLIWWKDQLSRPCDLRRTIRLIRPTDPPWIIYTDAHGKGGIGAILCESARPRIKSWITTTCPRSITASFNYRRTQIVMFELLAIPLAILQWASLLQGRRVIFFIDNQSSLGAVVNGSSAVDDLNQWVGILHKILRTYQIEPFWHWVPSDYNLADPPSRGRSPTLAHPYPQSAVWDQILRIWNEP
jgi:hypothetical protein